MYEICALTNNHPSVSYSTHDVYVGSTVRRVSFAGENFHEFRVSVVIHESFLRENLFSSN